MVTSPCLREIDRIVADEPCYLIKYVYYQLEKELKEKLETEKIAGSFDESWKRQIIIARKLKNHFEKMMNECGKYEKKSQKCDRDPCNLAIKGERKELR